MRTLPAYLEEFHGIDICRKTLYNWAKEHPEFAKRLERGKEVAQMEMEYLLRADQLGNTPKGATKINSKSLHFALKTRFHKDFGSNAKEEEDFLEEKKDDEKIVIVRADDEG